MPYLNVMTHIEDREDDELLHDLGGREHPTFLFLDAAGEVLARHDGDDPSVKALTETGHRVQRSLELRKQADGGDETAKIELVIVQGELSILEFPDVEAALEGAKLTPEQGRALGTLRADAKVSDLMLMLRKSRDAAAKSMAAEEFLALYKQGQHPARLTNRRLYWAVLAGQAVAKKDAKMLRDAIEAARELAGPEPSEREAQMLADLDERLKEIEAAK